MSMLKPIILGLAIGALISFIDSYSYAVSGFTTAEISIIVAPFLVAALSRCLRIELSTQELVFASAIAIGFDITTTLTAGMYITYGFLAYLASKLSFFGIDVEVPRTLFVYPRSVYDPTCLPTYVALSIISLSGAFIAYTLRRHYIERERLMYPLGIAASILVNSVRRLKHSHSIAIVVGFLTKLLSLRYSLFLDLTPITSSVLPGSICALSCDPLVLFLLLLIPVSALLSIALGSLTTYLAILPLTIAISKTCSIPMIDYENALFTYSNTVASILVGVIAVVSTYYIAVYRREFRHSIAIAFRLRAERTSLLCGLALISLMIPLAISIAIRLPQLHILIPLALAVIALHIVLTFVNLRVVGEAGFSSQSILPIATAILYAAGIRDVGFYAATDPFTGIPMPQVVGGVAMNSIRFAQTLAVSSALAIAGVGIGLCIGSFVTYIYGTTLVYVYGFNSSQMPLYRWIPTVVWMASVYSGKIASIDPYALVIGVAIGIILVVLNRIKGIPAFAFAIGMVLPPDIGLLVGIVYIIKKVAMKLGVEVHEKLMSTSTLCLVGAGIAIAVYTIATLFS